MAPALAMTSLQSGGQGQEAPAPAFGKPGPAAGAMGAEEEGGGGGKPKAGPAPLPFSVEALMADHRKRDGLACAAPPAGRSAHPRTLSPSLGGSSSAAAPERSASPLALASPFAVGGSGQLPEEALLKAESSEPPDRTPWMPSPRFSPPPPPKETCRNNCLRCSPYGRRIQRTMAIEREGGDIREQLPSSDKEKNILFKR